MKILKSFLIITIFIILTKFSLAEEKNSELLKIKISKNIRCLICQGQSVYDSQSDFSLSMKLVIEKKIEEGLKEEEIYEFLINQYGQWISYNPEFNRKTFVLWALPVVLFLIGGVIIFRKLIVLK